MFNMTDFANKLLRDMARAQVPPQPEDDRDDGQQQATDAQQEQQHE